MFCFPYDIKNMYIKNNPNNTYTRSLRAYMLNDLSEILYKNRKLNKRKQKRTILIKLKYLNLYKADYMFLVSS